MYRNENRFYSFSAYGDKSMKFADKLFFTMTVLLTVIFALFGVWMLSSYFDKAIDREMDRANAESGMFQLMFESAYKPMQNYGDAYTVPVVMESIAFGIENNGNYCLVWDDEEQYYCNAGISEELAHRMKEIGNELPISLVKLIVDAEEGIRYEEISNEVPVVAYQSEDSVLTSSVVYSSDGDDNYAVTIANLKEEYFIITVCKSYVNEKGIYLGMSRNITEVYETRKMLITLYSISLSILLVTGGACIFVLSRYITKPIRKLNHVVNDISKGDYEKRCEVNSNDEIGTLAENFNQMTDVIVEHMHQKELEALQKESFTTAFAHELKTPLTSIIGYADMLNTVEMSDKERREAYYYIYSQGKRLESLSHKLLELAEVDKNPLKTREVSTKELEANLKITMRPVFEKKKIKGKIIMEKAWLEVDKDLILSVFYNLLDNAVKAVEEGGSISLHGIRMAEGSYEIKVSDNGRGIPEEEIHRITEAFYMVDKSRSRKEGGAGIGMALCQKIVTLHNAQMHIYSKLGEGTVVQLLFPNHSEEV